jgi:hypothetical protein
MNSTRKNLTKAEKEILIELLNKEKREISLEVLIFLGISIVFIFLPGKGKRLSLYNEYGFLIAFLIVFGIGLLIYFYDKKEKIDGLKKDITSAEKIIEVLRITDKDTSLKNDYFIKTDSSILSFQKIVIKKEEFRHLNIGQAIMLEYGEYSKTLFKTNLNIN